MNASSTLSRLTLPVATAVVLYACDRPSPVDLPEDLTSPEDRIMAIHPAPGPGLPFRMRSQAVLLRQVFAEGFGPPTFGKSLFDGRCSVPSDFTLRFSLEGEATHLGHLTGTAEHCSQVDFSSGATTTSDGVLTLRAADGDELFGRYEGVPGELGVEEHITFTGGTGRFSSSSGSAVGVAICDRAAGTCVFNVDGVIAYRAAIVSSGS